jgi:hypothetical protein
MDLKDGFDRKTIAVIDGLTVLMQCTAPVKQFSKQKLVKDKKLVLSNLRISVRSRLLKLFI